MLAEEEEILLVVAKRCYHLHNYSFWQKIDAKLALLQLVVANRCHHLHYILGNTQNNKIITACGDKETPPITLYIIDTLLKTQVIIYIIHLFLLVHNYNPTCKLMDLLVGTSLVTTTYDSWLLLMVIPW